jgi:secreted Zn-dependent insulinase-like peptidase
MISVPVIVISFLLFSGCPKIDNSFSVQDEKTVEPLRKSPNDPRNYDTFVLGNGMEVLVISDPNTDVAATSLRVRVGNFSDPWDRQGLAHFLEHMLLISSKKYPKVDSYRRFIADHGGQANASTGKEHTSYFFSIDQGYLEPALDRLSQFFIAPELDPEYVQRERNAVYSEFSMNLKNDGRRTLEVSRQVVNPEHPYAKFSVGNLETLADRESAPILDDLWSFYQSEYTASRMTLSVLGREDVQELRELVTSTFSGVPTNGKSAPVLEEKRPVPYLEEHLGVQINVEAIGQVRELTLQFPCPPSEEYFMESPTGVILSLIQDKGEGSLFSLLKENGLVESLSTQYWRGGDDFKILSIDIGLTEDGLENYETVIEHFFQYVRLLSNDDLKRYFEEGKQISKFDFQFLEPEAPLRTVQMSSLLLQYYPTQHVVDFFSVYGDYNDALVRMYLSNLTPSNMQAILLAPSVETNMVEAIYNTSYSVEAFDSGLMKRWMESPIDTALSLPKPNLYIATQTKMNPGSNSEIPVLLKDELGLKVWHLHDSSFNVPQANVQVNIHTPFVNQSIHNRVCNSLFSSLLSESIREFLSPLAKAGMSVDISSSWKGLHLELGGYNEKQVEVLTELSHTIRNFELDEDLFAQEKSKLIRHWRNFHNMRPLAQGSQTGFRLLRPTYNEQSTSADTLEMVSIEEFQHFVAQWFNEVSVQLLIHGNHNTEVAFKLAEVTEEYYLEDATSVDWPTSSIRRIPPGELIQDIEIEHADSVFIAIYQGGETTISAQARYKLMGELISSDFFTEIRTKQQLGYSVNAFYNQLDRVPGFRMIIQSSAAGPAVLQERVDAFLVEQKYRIKSMSEDEFETVKQSVIYQLEQRDGSLSLRTDRLALALELGYTHFNYNKQLAEELKLLSKDEIVNLYEEVFFGEERGRILVRGTGSMHLDEAPSKTCFGADCVLPKLVERIQ